MLVKRYLTDGYCLLVCGSLRTCSIRASFGLGFGFAETKTTKLSPKLFFISLGSGMMEPSGSAFCKGGAYPLSLATLQS